MEQATEAAKLKEEEESVKAPPGFQRNTAVEENERRGSHPVGPGFPIDTKADPIEFPRSQSPPNTLPTSNSQSLQASQAEGGKGIPLSATTKEEADENTPSPQSAVKNPERKSGGEPPKSSEAIATSAEGSMPQQSAYSTAEQNQLSSVEPLAEKPEPMALSKNTRGKIQPAPGRELATAPASRKKMPWSIYWQGLVHWAGKATSLDEEKGLKVEPIKSTTQGKEITPRKFNIGGKGTTQGKGTTPLKSRKSSIAGKGATQGQGSDGRGREDGMGRKIAETLLQPMGLWVKTRNLIDNEALPNGIPRITSFIASDSDGLTSIYRRFDKLNVRNLLLLEAKLAALEALQEKLDKEDVKNFQGDLQYNFTMSSTHSSFEWFALLGEGRDVINQDELDSSGRGIALKKAAPCKVRGKDGMVNIHGAGNYVNVSYSGREGKSGIPAFAFREWEKTRKKASENFAENVDDEIAELPEPRREALKEVVLEEDRPYWQNRWEVAQAIQHALKEYQEAVVLHNKMLKLQRPTKGTVEALKTYIRGTHIDEDDKEVTSDVEDQEIEDEGAEDKGIEDEGAEDAGIEEKLRPRQFAVQSAADTMLEGDEDFVSLHPPGDDDLGTTLAAWCFGWLLKRRGSNNEEFNDVSEIAVGRFTTVWTFIVAIGFLMGAVWLLWRIGLEDINVEVKFERKLVVLTSFTALFGGWIALFTSAKRYEIFGATAAYAAVLIVFVGIDPGDLVGP